MAATRLLLQWNPTNLCRSAVLPSISSCSISRLVFDHPIAWPRYLLPLEASRRVPGYSQEDGLSFGGRGSFDRFDVGEDDEEDEEEEEDRSLDLLVQFVQNVFRKVSWRARKVVRSMLPRSIPSKLVVCTLGSIVFVCILVTRGVWSALMSHQEYDRSKFADMDDDGNVWSGAQPAT